MVDGLKFNLLSMSQLCDKGNQVIFDKKKYVAKIVIHTTYTLPL